MFDIHSVTLEDFKSYAGKHEFVFPEEAGLYFLTGSNDVEPRLGSNGAGKSTVLDAIYWCLYGKTLRGLKASDVVTWGKKSCSVTIEITCGGENVCITRTQNPNSLDIDGKTVEQVEKYIGLTPDAFTYSVMMPQYNQSFFELTPTNKLALFSGILNLDNWLVHSKKAADLATDIEADIATHSRQIGGLEIAITSATQEIENLIDSRDGFDTEREKVVADLKAQIERSSKSLKEATEERRSTVDDLNVITATIEELYGEYQGQTQLKEKCAAKANELSKDYAVLSSKVEAAFKATEKLTKIGPECPICLQKVDAKHVEKERKKANDELELLRTSWRLVEGNWEKAKRDLQKATKSNEIRHDELVGLQSKERKLSQQVKYFDLEVSTLKQKIDGLKQQIEAKPTNPYVALLAAKREKLKGYKADQASLNNTIEALNSEHEAVSFWVSGFKRVRLHIIEEALNALEIEVNNSLTNLGLVGWSIEFDVERENKSGSITKGFMVFVRAPGQLEPVRLEAWSGGESQRLQLACDLGLANLIMQQAGLKNTIEFYDEPSKHLSKAGLVDLAETLHQRAMDDGKRIFLVDHNMPEFGEFADVITVTKSEEGSTIQ